MSEKPSLEDIFLNQVDICRPNYNERLQWNPTSQALEDSNTGYSLTLSAFLTFWPGTNWRRWESPIAEPQPCPRCGESVFTAGSEHSHFVSCNKTGGLCGVAGPSCSTEREAIDEWNKFSYGSKT